MAAFMESMTREPQAQLSILEAIHRNSRCTQRDLAKKTGLPLSYINRIVRGLISRELVNVKALTGKSLLYDLTPKGISEKASLTIRSVREAMASYEEIRGRIMDLCFMLKDKGKTELVLCGVSIEAEVVYLAALETGLEIVRIVDDHDIGRQWLKMSIEPIAALSNDMYDQVIVSDMDRFPHLINLLLAEEVPSERILLCAGQRIKAVTTFEVVDGLTGE